jgi:CRP-like cAMP-binding protein
MIEKHSFRPHPGAPIQPKDSKRADSAQHSPWQNHLLAALPPEVYERLLPDLEPAPLPLGRTVHAAGERDKYVYFLTAGIVSRFYTIEDGASTDYAVTGSEGAIGVGCFLGDEGSSSQAVVVSTGHAYRLRADLLKKEFEHGGPLPLLLMRYLLAVIAQAGQIAVCTRHHSLEQQLCRWILSCLDRLPSNDLIMTQELISHMLGVRREGVTEAAGNLQKLGIVHYARGHIAVLDLPLLNAHACECNGVVRREYARLLPAEKSIGNAGVCGHAKPVARS